MIDTDLWNDDDIIADFTAEDKYFWLYLLTNPHNNICGVSKYSPALMARDMGLHKDTIINLLYRFEKVHNRLYVDKKTNEILILNWSKYNWTKSEDFLKTIEKQLKDVKSAEIQKILIEKINEKQGKTVLRPSQEGTNSITNTNYYSILDNYNFSAEVKDSIIKWLNYKKEKKQTYKDIGLTTLLNKLLKQAKDYGDKYVIDSIENSITNNWSGIFAPKTQTPTKTYGANGIAIKPDSELSEGERAFAEFMDKEVEGNG
jgi:uncharacterized protein YehS (DUF1456 family)